MAVARSGAGPRDLDYRVRDDLASEVHERTLAAAVASDCPAGTKGGTHGRDAVTLAAEARLRCEADPLKETYPQRWPTPEVLSDPSSPR